MNRKLPAETVRDGGRIEVLPEKEQPQPLAQQKPRLVKPPSKAEPQNEEA